MGSAVAGGATLHACDWSSTVTDGQPGAGPAALRPGGTWSWQGRLWRLDTGAGPLRLEGAAGRADLHRVAAGRAPRLLGRPRRFDLVPERAAARSARRQVWDDPLLRESFRVTDGRRAWTVACLRCGGGRPRMALFEGAVPPPAADLWIVDGGGGAGGGAGDGHVAASSPGCAMRCPRAADAVAGLSPDLRVETPAGPVPAGRLRPGAPVLTDSGPARLGGVRLRPGAPGLWLPAALLGAEGEPLAVAVGPDTWIGAEGAALDALFGRREALVRAGDLHGLPGVRALRGMDVVALALEPGAPRAALIMAGGLPCLLGPPGQAGLRALSRAEAQIALGHGALGAPPRLVSGAPA